MSRTKWVLVTLAAMLLIGVTPALAQNEGTGPVGGWAAGICNGVGSMAGTIADALGLSPEELAEAREEGKSLSEIADEKGLEQDDVIEAVIEARAETLQQAVEDGRITQERADLMIERMRERFEQRAAGEGFGPQGGFGGCGGPAGGGFGGGPGAGGCGGAGPAVGTTAI